MLKKGLHQARHDNRKVVKCFDGQTFSTQGLNECLHITVGSLRRALYSQLELKTSETIGEEVQTVLMS